MEKTGKQTEDERLQEIKREEQLEEALELSNAASATDATGSVPTAPVTGEQLAGYEATYHFRPTTVTAHKKQ